MNHGSPEWVQAASLWQLVALVTVTAVMVFAGATTAILASREKDHDRRQGLWTASGIITLITAFCLVVVVMVGGYLYGDVMAPEGSPWREKEKP